MNKENNKQNLTSSPLPAGEGKGVRLLLDDGTVFHGKSFGYEKTVAGEVVFNTAMTGYPESLTDPSYAGQLMTLTYPLVGNYGVPPFTVEPNGLATFMESGHIHAEAIIVSDYSENYNHWNAVESLDDWLKREQVPGITGIDTRELTKILREHGVMMGKIVFDDEPDSGQWGVDNYGDINYVDRVSCKDIIAYAGTESLHLSVDAPAAQLNAQLSDLDSRILNLNSGSLNLNSGSLDLNSRRKKRVLLVDCGVKTNIIRCLLKRDVTVVRVPWDYDYNGLEFDGLFISNGPGDPDTCDAAVQNIRKAMKDEALPIFGICMGNQLAAKAGGAMLYKMNYGLRSHNQPVRMVGTERCFITSQNHGYAVDNGTLNEDWEPLFINMNDGSNEGIRHKRNPWFSAQFHPEAASGPTDTEFLFDDFVKLVMGGF